MVSYRIIAAKCLQKIITSRYTIEQSLAPYRSEPKLSAIKACCFDVCRWYYSLNHIARSLLKKPIDQKHQDIHALLLIGLLQLWKTDQAQHAIINETVEACRHLKKGWATGLMNRNLREFQRKKSHYLSLLEQDDQALYSHPKWFIDEVKKHHPSAWQSMLEQNNHYPPLFLRVNQRKISTTAFLEQLKSAGIEAEPCTAINTAIKVTNPLPVEKLPGFSDGLFSVQDISGQLVIPLLQPQPGDRILDACAAPGSKTTHLLEQYPDCHVVAIDNSKKRLKRLEENISRLQLGKGHLLIRCGDAMHDTWWDKQAFDRILLDAPCSGSGVIRRNPDIKLTRQASDIAEQVNKQHQLLSTLWQRLAPGGTLIYSTCSILPQENEQLIDRFCASTPSAKRLKLSLPFDSLNGQLLTGVYNNDGFFISKLIKSQ